ncbi:hypothetical protein P154DRAFT_528085 [Amniculicola lignicola CBS 123094]|uniref:Uncharacterized protein n=1 Tax=Amniculicola lignicola CBS 123094 TaxID=1392246 RepID=A0A6A5VVX9_9PLEO|nr:hypothetical protein P154DRAFT_528085 [Amniculicola lignicola CBS 123094]
MPRQTSHKNRAQEEGAMVAQFDELQKYLYKRKATDQLDLLPSASKLHFEDMRFGSLGGSDRKWVSKQLFLGEGRDWAMWAILETSNRGGVSFVLEQFHGGERRAQMLDNANGLEIMYPFRAVSENRYSARQLEVLVAYFFLEAGHSTRVFPPTSANVSFKAFAACLMAIEKFYQDNGGKLASGIAARTELIYSRYRQHPWGLRSRPNKNPRARGGARCGR